MKITALAFITAAFFTPASLRAQQSVAETKSFTDSGTAPAADAGARIEEMKKKMEESRREHEKRVEELKLKSPGGGGGSEQKHESANKSSSSSSQSSSGSGTSTFNANGTATMITRAKGPDGKEKITVTTLKPGSKMKVRELTPEEFQKEFGEKRRPAKKDDGKADPKKPEPAAADFPKLPTQDAATE